jgi:hypothetical protein
MKSDKEIILEYEGFLKVGNPCQVSLRAEGEAAVSAAAISAAAIEIASSGFRKTLSSLSVAIAPFDIDH